MRRCAGALKIFLLAAVIAAAALCTAPPARADFSISFYLGASQTQPSDLHVVQTSRGNDATMRNVPWPGYPFRFEPYYGLRLTYTPPGQPLMRVALDFAHYKIYARTEDEVVQDGTWHGAAFRLTASDRRGLCPDVTPKHSTNLPA